jgi:hypothetical protein
MAKISFFVILFASIFTITIASAPNADIDYLHKCAKHMGECGKQVYNKMFTSNNTIITEDCCYKLFQTGYYCHTKMTLSVLLTDQRFKNKEWIHFLSQADKIYHTCDLVSRPENTTNLATCVEQIGSDCGEEVFNGIVNGKNVTEQCCGKLVKMGLNCHTNMAKALIRTPEMKDVDAIQFLEKNKKIFDHCKSIIN